MATSDQIVALIDSHYAGDGERFLSVAKQIACRASASSSSRINKIIERQKEPHLVPLPSGRDRNDLLLDNLKPRFVLSDLVLSDETRSWLSEIVLEYSNSHLLSEHGLLPCIRILFDGPPGVGKTAGAEAVAKELGVPFLVARHDTIISSYLGETASNLRKVFDWAGTQRSVVLFDEFDSFGRQRGDSKDVGEMNRILNVLLQLFDRHTGPAMVIAATNLSGVLDSALSRRFDYAVKFSPPTREQMKELVRRHLGEDCCLEFDGSHAEVVRECTITKKRKVLQK